MNDTAAALADTAVRERLLALIAQILGTQAHAIPPEAPLAELGMSSIKMVNLMLAVEGEFDLSIPQQDITPANFRSLVSVEAMLGRLLAAKS